MKAEASNRADLRIYPMGSGSDYTPFLQHLGIERAHFVGQSYGGAIILQVALDAPETVHSLALLEPALPSVMFKINPNNRLR